MVVYPNVQLLPSSSKLSSYFNLKLLIEHGETNVEIDSIEE